MLHLKMKLIAKLDGKCDRYEYNMEGISFMKNYEYLTRSLVFSNFKLNMDVTCNMFHI